MEGLSRAFSMAKPVVYAAEHEHSLQLSGEARGAYYLIASGPDTIGHVTTVTTFPGMLFAHAHPGFLSLDFER